jgi:hypothetical protein
MMSWFDINDLCKIAQYGDRETQPIWIALLGLGILLGQSDRSLAITQTLDTAAKRWNLESTLTGTCPQLLKAQNKDWTQPYGPLHHGAFDRKIRVELEQGNPLGAIASLRQAITVLSSPAAGQVATYDLVANLGIESKPTKLDRITQAAKQNPSYRPPTEALLKALATMVQQLERKYSFWKSALQFQLAKKYTALGQQQHADALFAEAQKTASLIQLPLPEGGYDNGLPPMVMVLPNGKVPPVPVVSQEEFQLRVLLNAAEEFLEMNEPQRVDALVEQSISLVTPFIKTSRKNQYSYSFVSELQRIAVIKIKLGQKPPTFPPMGSLRQQALFQKPIDTAQMDEYLRLGQFEPALEIARKLPPISEPILKVAIAAVAQNKLEQGDALFLEALHKRPIDPDHYYEYDTRASMIAQYAKSGRFEFSLQAAQRLEHPYMQIRAIALLAVVAENSEQKAMAVSLSQQVVAQLKALDQTAKPFKSDDRLVRDVATARLPLTYELARRASAATDPTADFALDKGDLELADQLIQALPQNYEKDRYWHRLAVEYVKRNNVNRAIKVVEPLSDYFHIRGLVEIAIQLYRQKQPEQGSAVLAQAQQLANSFASPVKKMDWRAEIALYLAQANLADPFEQSIDALIPDAQKQLSPLFLNRLLYYVATNAQLSGQSTQALRVAKVIPDQTMRDDALFWLLSYSELPQTPLNTEVLKQIERSEIRTLGLIELAKNSFEQAQNPAALQFLKRAEQTAQTIRLNIKTPLGNRDPRDRDNLLGEIVLLYAKMQQHSQGNQALEKIQSQDRRNQVRQQLQCYRPQA